MVFRVDTATIFHNYWAEKLSRCLFGRENSIVALVVIAYTFYVVTVDYALLAL